LPPKDHSPLPWEDFWLWAPDPAAAMLSSEAGVSGAHLQLPVGEEGGTMLEIVDLSKRYGDQVALDACSFQVVPGRLTGFLGPNGAGNTTAMRCMMGLVHADRGQVLWQGRPVGPAERLRFGYMPEERGLYPRMDVREQLVYLGRLAGLERPAASRAADRRLARLGLANRATDRLERLSHGNQQRAQLAAALVGDPMLLVLDEPFAGLDPLAIDTLGGLLQVHAMDKVSAPTTWASTPQAMCWSGRRSV
jgi:ABC-2 type transport system ATP-binding protein